MIKTFHEAPKSIFDKVQRLTDGDYFLVHLFDEDPEYLQLAKDAVAKGREVILDNSVFELGEAFNMQKFADWINELKPTYYIVPDSLEDISGTIQNMKTWVEDYKPRVNPKCKMIGVAQGKNYEEITKCYWYMCKVARVDKVAISFDYSYYEQSFPHTSKYVSWMMGRVKLLGDMLKDGLIKKDVPMHLLGTALPQEFKYYDDERYSFIDSCDSSNPVVHGMSGVLYEQMEGLRDKISTKLYTMINAIVDDRQWEYVRYNIGVFRKFCNQNWYLHGKKEEKNAC